jgi:hypothetical protein
MTNTLSRGRFRTIAYSLGGVLLVLYAPIGASIIGLTALLTCRVKLEPGSILLWLGFLVPTAVLLIFLREPASLIQLATQAALGLAAAALLRVPLGLARVGLQVGIGLLLVAMLISQAATPYLWNNRATDNIANHLLSRLITGEEEIEGSQSRTWIVPAESREAVLHFTARRTSGLPGWDWLVNDQVSVTPMVDRGDPYSRLQFGTAGDPYAQRNIGTGAPVGGRSFRVSLEIRSTRPPPPRKRGCRGVWLQVWGEGGGSSCKAVDPTGDWTLVEHEWTTPANASSSIIRVILNDFDDSTIEVRSVRLWEQRETGWSRLFPLVPEDTGLYLRWGTGGDEEERLFAFGAGEAPADYRFQVPLHVSPQATSVTATLETPTGVRIAISDTYLTTTAGKLRPLFESVRQSLWFDHPNLLGHTVATVGLVAILLSRTPLQGFASFMLAATTLLPTGSRTALFVFLLASTTLMLLSFREHRRLIVASVIPVLLAATITLAVSLAGTSTMPRILPFNTGQSTPRIGIWQLAFTTFLDRPVSGTVGDRETLETLWRKQDTSAERVAHAHNLTLEFASHYGLPGLLSALWLSTGLLILAWRRGGWNGFTFAGGVLLMNQFDFSLFYGGVLLPLMLGLNMLGEAKRADDVATCRRASGSNELNASPSLGEGRQ